MRELAPANESDIVLAWLRAEIDATRYGETLSLLLTVMGCSRQELIDAADPSSIGQNNERACLFGMLRGYRRNKMLFTGFPDDVTWRVCEVTLSELGAFRYANNVEELQALAGSTRLVSAGAATLAGETTRSVLPMELLERWRAVRQRVDAGEQFPELIAVRDSGAPDTIVLMEGHTRATAYVMTQKPAIVRLFLGISDRMHRWAFY